MNQIGSTARPLPSTASYKRREVRQWWWSVSLALLVISCSEKPEQDRSDVSIESRGESAKTLVAPESRLPDDEDEIDEDEIDRLVAQSPRQAFDSLSEIESDQKRHSGLFHFFDILAKNDLDLAIEMLPDEMSYEEQKDWAAPMAGLLIKANRLEDAADFIHSHFPGKVRVNAIGEAVASLFAVTKDTDVILRFWGLLEPGKGKTGNARSFAWELSGIDPLTAVRWFESLDIASERLRARDGIAARDLDRLEEQLLLASSAELRSVLASELGTRLTALPMSEAKEKLSAVPENLRAKAESAYVRGLAGRPEFKGNVEVLEAYIQDTLTPKGEIQGYCALAVERFSRNPKLGLGTLLKTGRSDDMTINTWKELVGNWLSHDGIRASTYVAELPVGRLRTEAIKSMIEFLEYEGDRDSALKWKQHLQEGSGS